MPKWKPCKRRVFIKKLVKLGFNGPEPGGRHFYMRHGTKVLTIPTNDEYSVPLLKMMIKELEKLIGRTITIEVQRGRKLPTLVVEMNFPLRLFSV